MSRAIATAVVTLVLAGGLAGALAGSASPDARRPLSRQAAAPGSYALTPNGLAFPTRTEGWVVASRGLAGGALVRLPMHVNQVAFASASLGVAAAQDAACRETSSGPPPVCPGWVLETQDGGRRWRAIMKSPEAIVAVAAGHGGLWAVDAVPGSPARPPSLVVFSSGNGGASWRARGAVHPDMIADLDLTAQVVPRPGAGLWLSALDRGSCAMHGCGLAEGWSSTDAGRRWTPLDFPNRFDRGVGMPCAAGQPYIAGAWAAVSFGFQSCFGPVGALYRLRRSHATVLHVWPRFDPIALAAPGPTVAYALGTDPRDRYTVRRSTDGGRTWVVAWPVARSRHRVREVSFAR